MVIQVSIDTTEPLTGVATSCDREPVPFVGWLQMLRAVADLVAVSECAASCAADAEHAPADHIPTGQLAGEPLPS